MSKPDSKSPAEQLAEAHQRVLDTMDQHIAMLETNLANAQAERREYINRHNLNKG